MNARWPEREWERISLPRTLAADVGGVRAAAERIGSFALFAAVRGRVVLEHGAVAVPVGLQSVRKALMNALVGRAVADGRLRLESTMAELGVDDVDGEATSPAWPDILPVLLSTARLCQAVER
jgi:CubicO group peptidase (beta-lactamase class C family)